MSFGHNNLKRVIHRSIEELKATKEIANVTTLNGAIDTFIAKIDIQTGVRTGFRETPAVRKRLEKKHKVMLEYFEKKMADFLNTYDYDRHLEMDRENLRNCIWVCWWQGIDNAPDIVKKCIESIQKNSRNKLIVVTEKNYREYVTIPEWIEDKKRTGIISRTHFADVLRLSLLAEHGGMWLDATFFCAKQNIDEYFKYAVWTIKRPDYLHYSVAQGHFANYSWFCSYEKRWVFVTFRDFFLNYWKNNNTLIDYLTLDYMIVLAQYKDLRIKREFDQIPSNNPACDELYKILGEPYDEEIWSKLKEKTSLFKLSWKQEFPMQKNGRETFYAKLLDGTL